MRCTLTCPPQLVNEIHGSWYDKKNVVVKMWGTLREDLVDRMEHTADVADLVLVLPQSSVAVNVTVALPVAPQPSLNSM